MQKKKINSLTHWINDVTVKEVATLLQVTEASVRHWRRGHCLPHSDQMLKIKKFTSGQLTCDKMIADFHRQK